MSIAAGLVLALASAAALSWGFFTQHGAASALPPLSLRRPLHSLRLLFADRSWLAGFFIGIAGWAFYVAALALAPLSLVQATSAGGIGLLAFLVHRGHEAGLPRREWVAVAVAVGGLALLGLSLAGGTSSGSTPSWKAVAVWIGVSVATAGAAAGPIRAALAAGAGLGVASGVLYAAGDVGTKAAVLGGAWLLLVPVVLACHGLAFVALQLGFQRGSALATAGVSSLLTNSLPIAAGVSLFAEHVPGGVLGALRLLAFCCVVRGAAGLARPELPARVDVGEEPVGARVPEPDQHREQETAGSRQHPAREPV